MSKITVYCHILPQTVVYCHVLPFNNTDLYHMKLLKSGTNKKQLKNKNGEKERQFAEMLVCTAL